jgi:hypothetical protein
MAARTTFPVRIRKSHDRVVYIGELSRLATAEMVRYQNLGNTYSTQAWSAASRGDSIGGSLASMKASFAKHEATLQADTAFVYAVDLGLVVRRALEASAVKASIERQELFRRSIQMRSNFLRRFLVP